MAQASRPLSPIARPVKLETAFTDPGEVLALIRQGAPYKTQEAAHRHPDVTRTGGWFRNFWALGGKVVMDGAAPLFRNDIFIRAAKKAFNAEVVQPIAMTTNLNLPMAGLPPHLDLPFFRGLMNREVPAWMLVPMGYSGLFHHWAVPVASAITWFFDGEGGELEYWPEGLDGASRIERPPYFNTAILADNEYMYHRVGSVGREEDWLADDAIPFDARLHLEDDRWIVREDGRELFAHAYSRVRLSVLWKAYCFETEHAVTAFHNRTDDLTPSMVTEIFSADLRDRGIPHEPPTGDMPDETWKAVLEAAYPAPPLPENAKST